MYCLHISLNGQPLFAAGHEHALFIDAMVGGSLLDDASATLRVAGMLQGPDGRSAHMYWVQELELHAGDVITIRPCELDTATPPASIQYTDAPEYLAEMQAYEAYEQAHTHPHPPRRPARPNMSLVHQHPRAGQLKAGIPLGQQHLLCNVLWTRDAPWPARISTRSFSESDTLAWLHDELRLDEALGLRVSG